MEFFNEVNLWIRKIPWTFTFYASESPLQSPVLGWDQLRVIPSNDGAFYWSAWKVRCQKTDLGQENQNSGEGWWRPYLVPIINHASHLAPLRYNYYHISFKYEVTKILSLLKSLSQKGTYASLHLCICPKLNSCMSSHYMNLRSPLALSYSIFQGRFQI